MGQTDESMTLQVFTAKNLRSHPSVGFSIGGYMTLDHGAVLEGGDQKHENFQGM